MAKARPYMWMVAKLQGRGHIKAMYTRSAVTAFVYIISYYFSTISPYSVAG